MVSTPQRPIYRNEEAKSWVAPASEFGPHRLVFHRSLPGYEPTSLVSLDQIANEVGVKAVYLKNEGERLDQPSFKILGASWGIFMALTRKLGLSPNSNLAAVKAGLAAHPVTLYAATDGNHGLAVTCMGALLETPVEIFVPKGMWTSAIQRMTSAGASVSEIQGSYDEIVRHAVAVSQNSSSGILIQDTLFHEHEEMATWIVEGYATMMQEIDRQLGNQKPDLVVVPVGVGSFAQAVVSHSKAPGNGWTVLAVEPDTAACLYESLLQGQRHSIQTTPSIMTGLDYGTVSSIAWPLLHAGVDASLTVSDYEAHDACEILTSLGVSAGPCGAAPLAALRRLTAADKAALGLNNSSVVVLLCTERSREYSIPRDESVHDPISLRRT